MMSEQRYSIWLDEELPSARFLSPDLIADPVLLQSEVLDIVGINFVIKDENTGVAQGFPCKLTLLEADQ